MNSLSLVVVVLLGYAASSAFGFQCYICNSKNNSDCGSPPAERHLKTCEEHRYDNNAGESFKVCRLQIIQSERDGIIYDRRCGWKKHNENRETCILTGESTTIAASRKLRPEASSPRNHDSSSNSSCRVPLLI